MFTYRMQMGSVKGQWRLDTSELLYGVGVRWVMFLWIIIFGGGW